MFNWLKKFFCKEKNHIPKIQYSGLSVIGYICGSCGYQWYENKEFEKEINLSTRLNSGESISVDLEFSGTLELDLNSILCGTLIDAFHGDSIVVIAYDETIQRCKVIEMIPTENPRTTTILFKLKGVAK